MRITHYEHLDAWRFAMDLVVTCYQVSERFPRHEIYGLTAQLRRASVSVPANIAEGQGRNHTREFLQHLSIAYGSLMEVETHIRIAERLGYVEPDSGRALLGDSARVGRLFNGLKNAMERKIAEDARERKTASAQRNYRPPATGHRPPDDDSYSEPTDN